MRYLAPLKCDWTKQKEGLYISCAALLHRNKYSYLKRVAVKWWNATQITRSETSNLEWSPRPEIKTILFTEVILQNPWTLIFIETACVQWRSKGHNSANRHASLNTPNAKILFRVRTATESAAKLEQLAGNFLGMEKYWNFFK